MKQFRRLVALVTILWCASMSARAADVPDVFKHLLEASEGLKRGECDFAAWNKVFRDPDFSQVPSELRSFAYVAPVMCGVAGDREAELIGKAISEPDATALAWSVRFIHAAATKDRENALKALDVLADKADDQSLQLYNDRVLFDLWRELKDDKTARAQMATALYRIDWRPENPHTAGGSLWLAHAQELLAAGDTAGAARFARKITEPDMLVALRVDRRFAAIVDAEPSAFDAKFAALATLQAHRPELDQTPLNAEAVQAVAYDLRILGRFEEALAVLENGLKQKTLLNGQGEDWRNWIMNERAYVLFELGRYDEALDAMRKAGLEDERGGVNVSQTINLSSMLLDVGRYDDALKVLAPMSKPKRTSPYGAMWVTANRICANAGLDRLDRAKADLPSLDANAGENRAAHQRGLLCLGDEDGAARSIIAGLGEDDRTRALYVFSTSTITPLRPPPAQALEARFDRVRARPDVRAAFDKVGRAETFNVYLDVMEF